MTSKLPPNLLVLFAPRPPIRYIPPSDRAPEDKPPSQITGVAQYLDDLKAYDQQYPYNPSECWLQRKARLKEEKKESAQKKFAEQLVKYDPSSDPQIRGDPYRTLFVGRLSYSVTEADLEREFGRFGPIERIRIIEDPNADEKNPKKRNRGYAFIVYERERDMKAALKETDGIRIKDRRVVVDVERGRTVKDWKPTRLGGGLGGRGYTKALPARPMGPNGFPPSGPFGGGGFRGGGGKSGFRERGGFRDRFGGKGGYGSGRPSGGGGGGGGGYGGGYLSSRAPPNAPSGPSGGRSSGYGGGSHRYDRRDRYRERDYHERDRYRDRDRDRDDYYYHKSRSDRYR